MELVQGMNERINKDKRTAEEKGEVAKVLAKIRDLPSDFVAPRRLVRRKQHAKHSLTHACGVLAA